MCTLATGWGGQRSRRRAPPCAGGQIGGRGRHPSPDPAANVGRLLALEAKSGPRHGIRQPTLGIYSCGRSNRGGGAASLAGSGRGGDGGGQIVATARHPSPKVAAPGACARTSVGGSRGGARPHVVHRGHHHRGGMERGAPGLARGGPLPA
ncbi:hypothetical protein CFC21_083469 [Triticum aestivum]|uniref:Uncharacterized protein n=4 Tax=Triticum TaxID=4564 RepID=A0A9R1NNV7_TRITD|nr:hypothetical protein TRIUR3_23148 [Triticum urartu]KAF7079198.1 hypothetical protein CFC21_083469 [Triticum aestivum]VAH28415.1 unnamed protein product [Triticum turgidum subsp. durum]